MNTHDAIQHQMLWALTALWTHLLFPFGMLSQEIDIPLLRFLKYFLWLHFFFLRQLKQKCGLASLIPIISPLEYRRYTTVSGKLYEVEEHVAG